MSSIALDLISNDPIAANTVNAAGDQVAETSSSPVQDITLPLLRNAVPTTYVGKLECTIDWKKIPPSTLSYQTTLAYRMWSLGAGIGGACVSFAGVILIAAIVIASIISGYYAFLLLAIPAGALFRSYCKGRMEQIKIQDAAQTFINKSPKLIEAMSQAVSQGRGLRIQIENTPAEFYPIHQQILAELSENLSTPVTGYYYYGATVEMTLKQIKESKLYQPLPDICGLPNVVNDIILGLTAPEIAH